MDSRKNSKAQDDKQICPSLDNSFSSFTLACANTRRNVLDGDIWGDNSSDSESTISVESAVDIDPNNPKIFVGQLKPNITSYDLRTYFSKFGTVTEAQVVTNRKTGISKGFGFVTFADEWTMKEVLETCHFLDECHLNVKPAGSRGPHGYCRMHK
ncbi:unnamed protein product [Dibothriocephalus latus]|uniref:RRM domain-containing protein n=1 Tax=Dibothriocephalus latus TaxID=60516 RepID=A0A3P7LLP6_DIBLA|nr:unnamed protein product [Dibothriocephalus latus]